MNKELSIEEKDALMNDLLLNEKGLLKLTRYISEPNVFDILNVTNYEIRHSRILSWLLNPDENHELGDAFLRECIRIAIQRNNDSEDEYEFDDEIGNDIQKDLRDWLLDDFQTVDVNPEEKQGRNRLDISITAEGSSGQSYFIVIENKLRSKEHKRGGVSQTENYFTTIMSEDAYSHMKKLFIFLTIDEDEVAEDDHWVKLTYNDIIEALRNALIGKTIPKSALLIIEDYIKALERNYCDDENIVNSIEEIYGTHGQVIDMIFDVKRKRDKQKRDNITKPIEGYSEEFVRYSKQIYKRHSKALNLINNNKDKPNRVVAKYIRESLKRINKENPNIILTRINKVKYIQFNTKEMNSLLGGPLPEDKHSPWGTREKYYYEFRNMQVDNDTAVVSFYLALGGGDDLFLTDPDFREKALKIAKRYGAKENEDYQFKTCHIVENKKEYKRVFTVKRGKEKELEEKVYQYVNEMVNVVCNAEKGITTLFDGKAL